MAPILIKLVLAPGLMVVATLAQRKWGPRAAGVLAAFPAIVGPLLLVTALEHGAHAAALAAAGTLVGLVTLAAFSLAYAETARRRDWRLSLGAGWLAAALAAGAVEAWMGRMGALSDGAVAVVSLAGAGIALILPGRGRLPDTAPVLPPRPALATRAAVTALLVTALSVAVSRLGPAAGGMLAALPVVASMLTVFAHRGSGPGAAVEMLRGTVTGMAGFVVFCELVALTIVGLGTAAAFGLATAAALALQATLARGSRAYPWARNSAGRSGEASASASFRPSASRSAA
jgi:hypothetical protein